MPFQSSQKQQISDLDKDVFEEKREYKLKGTIHRSVHKVNASWCYCLNKSMTKFYVITQNDGVDYRLTEYDFKTIEELRSHALVSNQLKLE